MNKIPILLNICIYFLFSFLCPAQSIKSFRGSSFDIALTAQENIVRIPITIVADSGVVGFRLIDVTLDNPVRTISSSQFTPELITDSLKNQFLQIVVNNNHPLDQGKYHLGFNIIKSKQVSPSEQFFLDITVKPATLAPVTNQILFRVQNCPFTSFTPAYIPVTIFETSRNAILSPVTIRPLTLIDEKGAKVSDNIKFPKTGTVVPAGQQADFPYEVYGNLPIGTVTASFEISAPQLATPVLFKMDIITKRSGWWIIIIIFSGLLFGYITRTGLDTILQLNKSRKDANDLLAQLNEEVLDKPDQAFRSAIDKMRNDLKNSLTKKNPELSAKTTSVRTALSDALTDFNNRQTELQTKLKSFSDALTGIWFLSQEIEDIVSVARNSLNDMNRAILANNPGVAETVIVKINESLAKSLMTATQKFKNELSETYQGIKESTLKIAVVGSSLIDEIDKLTILATTIPEDEFDKSAENVRLLLQAISNQRRKTGALFFNIHLAIKSLLDTLTNMLANGNVDLQNDLLQIRDKAELKFILLSDKALDRVVITAETDLNEIQNDILQSFTSAKLGLKEDQIKTISDAIAAGQYTTAASNLVLFKAPAIVKQVAQQNDNIKPVSIPSFISFPFAQNSELVIAPVSMTDRSGKNVDISAIDTRRALIIRNIFVTSVLQTLLIGIGIAIFGYPLFAEKFYGTITDMIEVFSWAFVLDVSINTLTTVAGAVPNKIK